MSTYHEVIAKAFGTPDALGALEQLARAAESRADIRAAQFRVFQLETGIRDTGAAIYKSGLSRYWPVLRSFLRSNALATLDVCVYVVGLHECYAVYSECYYRGVKLASDDPTDSEFEDDAYRAFVNHAAKFGTHPERWRYSADLPGGGGRQAG